MGAAVERFEDSVPRQWAVEVVRAFFKLVEKVEPYTASHQADTARLAVRLALKLHLSPAAVHLVYCGALLHDIGKIAVPASLLLRPGKLTAVELALVREHPTIGWEIVSQIDFAEPVAALIAQHHERLDGSGYPRGLSDGAIQPEAMVVAVADTVQALLARRPYHLAESRHTVIERLERECDGPLPGPYVDAAIDLLRQGRAL